jgi:hypothetical protein
MGCPKRFYDRGAFHRGTTACLVINCHRIFEAALQAAASALLLLPFDEGVEPSGGGGVVPMSGPRRRDPDVLTPPQQAPMIEAEVEDLPEREYASGYRRRSHSRLFRANQVRASLCGPRRPD